MTDVKQSANSYLSPKIEIRPASNGRGYGMTAREFIPAGELLSVVGGNMYSREGLKALSPVIHTYSIQIEEDVFIAPTQEGEPSYLINHCCEPNAGIRGQISFVAMRDIQPGEEICFDYAMTDGTDYDEFTCLCGKPGCRGQITGNDWRNPELWKRYEGFFSSYMQRKIDAYRKETGK